MHTESTVFEADCKNELDFSNLASRPFNLKPVASDLIEILAPGLQYKNCSVV